MATAGSSAEEYRNAVRMTSAAAHGITDTVEQMHQAIARRSFGATRTPGRPVKAIHDGISNLVYNGVRAGIAAADALAGTAAQAAGTRRPAGSLVDTPSGRALAGFLNGAFGEHPHAPVNEMSVRVDGEEIPVETDALRSAFPDATGHLVLFLHGLTETERWWYPRPPKDGSTPRSDFGTRLTADLACTPVYLRYHTGRHISANGADLSKLVGELIDAWPEQVRRISVIGHSMGGLVTRSAMHLAVDAGSPWVNKLSDVVYLGTPHNGAPLELGAHLLSWALRRLPESAPLGKLLDVRSDGIKDLRYGYLHEEQWRDLDPGQLLDPSPRAAARTPGGVRQHFYTVTIGRDRDGFLARFLGDLLVTPASSEDLSQNATSRHWTGGLHHFDLLHHDEVYERLRHWLCTEMPEERPLRRRRRLLGRKAS